jgi:adenosylhomocysteine nucleosidase
MGGAAPWPFEARWAGGSDEDQGRLGEQRVLDVILAVVGLQREARIVAGRGVRVVVGGGDAIALGARLEQALDQTVNGVISFGVAGALAPALKPGDLVVASAVRDERRRLETNSAWMRAIMKRLPHAVGGAIAGSDAMVTTAEAKAALHGSSGAVAVDMESHVAARFAASHGLPLAVIRAVSDGADHALPPAAQRGMRPDGSMNIGAVLAELIKDPRQLPALIRTGIEAEKGFAALLRGHHLLGPALGLGGQFGDHALDMT